MNSSNLAERLEEYEARMQSRRPVRPARLSLALASEVEDRPTNVTRRRRIGGIRLREGGLKPFRVC